MSSDCEIGGQLVPREAMDVVTTLNDRLLTKKRRLEAELRDTNDALKALEDHPDVAKVLTLVGKAVGRSL